MAKILLTGANGFVGSHLLEKFAQAGHTVRCLVHRNRDFLDAFPKNNIETAGGSLDDQASLAKAVKGIEYIFHSAGLLGGKNIEQYCRINQLGTRNLIKAAYENNPNLKRFVYISSQAAMGPCETGRGKKVDSPPAPVSDYGRSKLLGEQEVLAFRDKINITILRPSSVYGPRDTDIFPFFKLASNGIFPILSQNPECRMQMVFVKDIAEICCLIMKKDKLKHDIYFLSESRHYSWDDIHMIISGLTGKKVRKIHLPYFLVHLSALVSENFKMPGKRPSTFNRQKVKELCQAYWVGDLSETTNEFNFNFTNFENGAKITYNWYKQNHWL